MKKKNLLSEAQITRFAAIAGIPAINRLSEKVEIQTEEAEETTAEATEETTAEATNEEVVTEQEMDMGAEEEMEMPAEEGGEEVSQDKIEALVDAVLAAIEAETGVPAQRVDAEEEAPAEEPEMEMGEEEPEMEMGDEAEEEMMEEATPSLAERIAAAVQSVLDEDAALEESNCTTNEEEIEEGKHEDEEMEEGYKADDEEKMDETTEEQLEEITKAVVARLRSLK
jgi:hypothetical protein